MTLVASQVRLRQASLATGTSHSCALDAAGAAWCWGFNQYGSLGDGTTTNRSTPVAVNGGLTFASLTAGALTTCGLTSAGVGYCWGAGGSGQIGDGGLVDRTAPAPIAGGLTFAATHGRRPPHLRAHARGQGVLLGPQPGGPGRRRHHHRDPAGADRGGQCHRRIGAGVRQPGGWRRPRLRTHQCGEGLLLGHNENGQVGDGTTNIQLIAPKAVNSNLAFTELTARNSSTCGLSGGALYCWGYNGAGQLGDGTTTQHRSPSPATGGPFATLAAGGTPDPSAIGIHVARSPAPARPTAGAATGPASSATAPTPTTASRRPSPAREAAARRVRQSLHRLHPHLRPHDRQCPLLLGLRQRRRARQRQRRRPEHADARDPRRAAHHHERRPELVHHRHRELDPLRRHAVQPGTAP